MSSDTSVARAARTKKAERIAEALGPMIADAVERNISFGRIAVALTVKEIPTPNGKSEWQANQVIRVYDRYVSLQRSSSA